MSPAGSALTRLRRSGLARSPRSSTSLPGEAVTDEQILAFVTAAHCLSRRQRDRCAVRTALADERLLRLDWAVRVGRLVLADRAASALPSTAGSTSRRRDDL